MTSVNFNKITGADHGGITDMCKCAGWLIQMTVATMLLRLALVPQKWITNWHAFQQLKNYPKWNNKIVYVICYHHLIVS